MDLNIRVLGKSFLGSLLLSLYYTGNITKGNIEKYNKKLGKEEHTLQEIIDYIENDKHTKLDLSSLVLVSHKDGKVIFNSLEDSQCVKYGTPKESRLITIGE